MVEIDELPESLRNPDDINIREVPQLKYVVEMSEKLCFNVGFWLSREHNCFQGGTLIFLQRYFDGIIDTSFKSSFQNNSDLQETLNAYCIDPTAFWYLILFLKDYVDDESAGKKLVDTAYTELCELASRLKDMDFFESPFDGSYQGCKNQGLLQVRVGGHWFTTSNDKTLFSIYSAIVRYLRSMKRHREVALIDGVWEELNSYEIEEDKEHLYTNSSKQEAETITIPETYRISYFTTYMRFFLNSFRTNIRSSRISTDKWLLISRVIYIIGYSSDVRYNQRKKSDYVTDMDFLKGNYKKDRYKYEVRREIYV